MLHFEQGDLARKLKSKIKLETCLGRLAVVDPAALLYPVSVHDSTLSFINRPLNTKTSLVRSGNKERDL